MLTKYITTFTVITALLFTAMGCGSSMVIQDVDFSQSIESVLTPDSDQTVHDQRFGIKFSIAKILEREGMQSVDEVRLIRNRAGYYFITADGFNNVYVFEPAERELKKKRIIEISSQGISNPAFNQRDRFIELVDRVSGQTYNIDHTGRR
ncbi:MAG: hypothetical protein EA391_13600 [Balneolaceae bacterium]|nr:MAG: hypothetical protein EA391_13600 [Balneolaceae bacterium]